MSNSEGRRADGKNINPAEHGQTEQPKSVSKSYFTRMSRFVRLGAARNMNQHGNSFRLVEWGDKKFHPTTRLAIDVHLFGRWIVFSVGMDVMRIADILADADSD